LGGNMLTLKRSIEVLMIVSKGIGLEVNAEKTK
jgi:hypothetical protein